jgi:hypothetical protein
MDERDGCIWVAMLSMRASNASVSHTIEVTGLFIVGA